MNTIRIFASGGFIERLDVQVKDICTKTDYGLLYLNSRQWLSDRETADEWIERFINPSIDCSSFSYIIIISFEGKKDFITPIPNTKIIYIND